MTLPNSLSYGQTGILRSIDLKKRREGESREGHFFSVPEASFCSSCFAGYKIRLG